MGVFVEADRCSTQGTTSVRAQFLVCYARSHRFGTWWFPFKTNSFIPVIAKRSDPSKGTAINADSLIGVSASLRDVNGWIYQTPQQNLIRWRPLHRAGCIGQDLVQGSWSHDLGTDIMFHNFGANWCHRHWSVICRRSVVNLLEDWDYVCCLPFYKDYGLPVEYSEYRSKLICCFLQESS